LAVLQEVSNKREVSSNRVYRALIELASSEFAAFLRIHAFHHLYLFAERQYNWLDNSLHHILACSTIFTILHQLGKAFKNELVLPDDGPLGTTIHRQNFFDNINCIGLHNFRMIYANVFEGSCCWQHQVFDVKSLQDVIKELLNIVLHSSTHVLH
jgi:hypothetical protein